MSTRSLFVLVLIAVGLAFLFWGPLWQGHGLIGGDLYTYFFPQKLVYAEQLARDRIPLWNNLVGFGYPLLAESQAGVFYPPNPPLYRWLNVNTAYNVSQLGHYVLAFLFTVMLLKRLDLSMPAAVLGGIVFVYGWFPPRICLEWAIIGGVYFPLSLWCVESFLQTGKLCWLFALSLAQGVHLLAGHFNLAFITQVTCVIYVGFRVSAVGCRVSGSGAGPNAERRHSNAARRFGLVAGALGIGFALAAVQLLPTWELKQLSQRDDVGQHHDPGYGHIPPWYLSQIVAPWLWYPEDVDPDLALQSIRVLTTPSATNKVEAHLYFGMVPLLLIAYRMLRALRGDRLQQREWIWLLLGLAAMLYATGWLLPITRHLPGFSFFMGPGRYGIVTTFAAALLAGAGLDRWLTRPRWVGRSMIIGVVIGLSVADLFWVSRRVTYAVMVEDPPIRHINESEVRQLLSDYVAAHGPLQSVRILAPGPNWATLTGFAAYPAYLGIGPAAYFDPALMMPEPTDEMGEEQRAAARAAQREWLREGAFTHVLSMDALDAAEWPQTRLVWQGIDRVLNPVYARWNEPIWLYELTDTLPRIRLEGAGTVRWIGESTPAIAVESPAETALVWADLAYPGWVARVRSDDEEVQVQTDQGVFRTVALPAGTSNVRWEFESASFQSGALISLISLVLLAFAGGLRRLRPVRPVASRSAPQSPPA